MKVIVSPRCAADHGSEVLTDGPVERCRKTCASQTPGVDVSQLKRRVLVRDSGPILMGNGVAPIVEILERRGALHLTAVDVTDLCPEVHPQTSEVGAQVAGVRIAVVELPSLHHHDLQDTRNNRGLCVRYQEVDGLRVEVATKALKLRRQQDSVRVIDLQSRIASTRPWPAEGTMSGGDLSQRRLAHPMPSLKSNRRHLSRHLARQPS